MTSNPREGTFRIDRAYIVEQAREAMRIYFAPLTFVYRLIRRAIQSRTEG
jgi:hypothetical protein